MCGKKDNDRKSFIWAKMMMMMMMMMMMNKTRNTEALVTLSLSLSYQNVPFVDEETRKEMTKKGRKKKPSKRIERKKYNMEQRRQLSGEDKKKNDKTKHAR
jgi:hypothetical protein